MQVQRNVPASKDTFGARKENWVTVATVWAKIEPLNSREILYGSQIQADVTHKLTLRYQASLALTADMRLVLGNRCFNLSGPPRDLEERHQFWELLAIEIPLPAPGD